MNIKCFVFALGRNYAFPFLHLTFETHTHTHTHTYIHTKKTLHVFSNICSNLKVWQEKKYTKWCWQPSKEVTKNHVFLFYLIRFHYKFCPYKKKGGRGSSQKNSLSFFFILFLRQKNHSFWYSIYLCQSLGKGKGDIVFVFSKKKEKNKVTSKRLKRVYYLNKTSNFTSSLVSNYIICWSPWLLKDT